MPLGQTKELRAINNAHYNSHTDPLYKACEIPKNWHIYEQQVHDFFNNKLPISFNGMFTLNRDRQKARETRQCMHAWHACMHVCSVCMYVCMYACMHACMCAILRAIRRAIRRADRRAGWYRRVSSGICMYYDCMYVSTRWEYYVCMHECIIYACIMYVCIFVRYSARLGGGIDVSQVIYACIMYVCMYAIRRTGGIDVSQVIYACIMIVSMHVSTRREYWEYYVCICMHACIMYVWWYTWVSNGICMYRHT